MEIFVCASMAGAELTVDLCRTLLVMLDNADAALPAVQMLENFILEVRKLYKSQSCPRKLLLIWSFLCASGSKAEGHLFIA